MRVRLARIAAPDLDIPAARPAPPAQTYARRCEAAYARAGCDWLAVYADREHIANIAFLTGFEPRFEEALFLLGPNARRVLIVGNESFDYAARAGLRDFELALCQTFSLLGQDRSRAPSLEAVLRDAGLARGQTVGIVGWKYLEPEDWETNGASYFAPAFLVSALQRVAGGAEALSERTPVLMHEATGLRAIIDADEIAACEWAAARASAAVWRIVQGVREGDSELAAAARMGYAGELLSCHVMLSSSDASAPVIGLASPTARTLRRGDGVTTAVGYWGALSSRAGLLDESDDAFLEVAKGYFRGLCAWYEAADIGVTGGTVHAAVVEALALAGLRPALNPGHLVSYDEWMNTPVRPDGPHALASGMAFQVDVIPAPQRRGAALNCEDAVVFADEGLRAEIRAKHPSVWGRIEARRAFLRDSLGVTLKPSILPLSNTPLCLPPFWLRRQEILAAE
jgi:Xaa-Pro aminopeptidase